MKKRTILKGLLSLLTVLALLACFGALAEEEQMPELEGWPVFAPFAVKGQTLNVQMPKATGEVQYEFTYRDTDENWAAADTISGTYSGAKTVELPTDKVAAGLWNVRLRIKTADGKPMLYNSQTVNILASEPEWAPVNLVVSHASKPLNKAAKVWAFAPDKANATVVGVKIDVVDGQDKLLGTWDAQGGACGVTYSFDDEQDITFTATAYYSDGTTATSSSALFQSVDTKEEINGFEPTISAISATNGLTVSFDKVTLNDAAQNVYYDMEVEEIGGGFYLMQAFKNKADTDEDSTDETIHCFDDAGDPAVHAEGGRTYMSFNIPASDLTPGHAYRVFINAYADGVAPVAVEKRLVYADGEAAEGLAVLVNGQTVSDILKENPNYGPDDELAMGFHERFFVRVEFPVGTTGVRFFDGTGFRYIFDEGDWTDTLELGYWSFSFDERWPAHWIMYAQSLTGEIDLDGDWDEMDWSAPSDIQYVKVLNVKDGADSDHVTLNNVPATVTRGDALSFDVTYAGNSNALWCGIAQAGTYEEFASTMIFKPQTRVTLPTANLEPGLYCINVNSLADEVGYGESWENRYFIVTEPSDWSESPEFLFSASPTEGVHAHQDFAVSAHLNGAKMIRIMDGEYELDRQYGDSYAGTLEMNEGRHELYAQAYMGEGDPDEDEENWAASAPLTMDIDAAERPEEYAFDGPGVVNAGQDYTFTVENLDQSDDFWWDIHVTKMVPGEDWVTVWRRTSDYCTAAGVENTFTIPEELLEGGCDYEISVWADSRYYGGEELRHTFYVAAPQTEGVTLKVNGATDSIDAQVFEEVHFEVNAPGAVALLVFDGNNWNNFGDYDPEADGHWEWDDCLRINNTVFAAKVAYADDYDWAAMEDDNFDWGSFRWQRDVSWTGVSNAVAINIASNGPAQPAVVADLAKDTYVRGEDIDVTITGAGTGKSAGRYFYAYFHGDDDDFDNDAWDAGNVADGDFPLHFKINTAELPEDDYKLMVASGALGYDWNTIEIPFSVQEAGPRLALRGVEDAADDEEADYLAYMGSELHFYATVPGVDGFDILWTPLDDDERSPDEWHMGRDYTADHRYREHGEGLFRADLVACVHTEDGEQGEDGEENGETQVEYDVLLTGPVVRVVARGWLDAPMITGDAVYKWTAPEEGEEPDPYTFAVDGLYQEGCEDWMVRVWDMDTQVYEPEEDNYHWELAYEIDKAAAAEGQAEFSVPYGSLTPGHAYCVWAEVNGEEGWHGSKNRDYYFYVSEGQQDQNVALTINGESESIDAQVREKVQFKAAAPGAVALLVFNGRDWRCLDGYKPDSDGYWHWDGDLDFENRCYVVKAAYEEDFDWASMEDGFDWEHFSWQDDVSWSAPSNIVLVNITSEGQAAPAVVSGVPESAVRGETLNLTLQSAGEGANRATQFHAYFRDCGGWSQNNNADWDARDIALPCTFTLNTAEMNEGRYRLVVDSSAVGYGWNSVEYPITITEDGAEATFEVLDTEIYQDEQFRYAAYVPGADKIDVHWRDIHWNKGREDDIWPYGGDSVSDSRGYGEGEFDIWAVAYRRVEGESESEDEESFEEIFSTESDPIRVTIHSRGDLKEPVVHGNALHALTPAESLEEGQENEPYRFTVDNLYQSGATWMDIQIQDKDARDEEGNWTRVYRFTSDTVEEGTTAFEVPADVLTIGHTYRIDAWVDGSGYNGCNGWLEFLAYDATAERIELKVNGSATAASGWAHMDEDWSVTVNAPGATAVRLVFDGRTECFNDLDEKGVWQQDGYWFDPGAYTIYAQASYDQGIDWEHMDWGQFDWNRDLTWTSVSNAVALTVNDKGTALEAQLSGVDQTLTQGQVFHFQITGGGDLSAANHATNFHAYIVDDNWNSDNINNYNLYGHKLEDFPIDVYMNTGYMDANQNWRLIVDACAPCYDWSHLEIPLSIVEPAAGEDGEAPIIFEVQDGGLYDETDFMFSAYSKGADWFTMNVYDLNDESETPKSLWEEGRWDGEHINGCSSLGVGRYSLQAVAHYVDEEGNETTRTSDVVTVSVEYRGIMPEPVVRADTQVEYGEGDGFTFSVDDLHWLGDNWYSIEIRDVDDNYNRIWYADRNTHGNEVTSFTIGWNELAPNHAYRMHSWLDNAGYQGTGYDFNFLVYQKTEKSITLKVNGSAESATGLTHKDEDWKISITAPGATAVRFWNGNGWEHYNNLDENGAWWTDGHWLESGTYDVYAQACYDEDVNWNSINDWNRELAWTGLSNTVRLTVASKGEAFLAETDADEYAVTRGQVFHFQITGGGDVNDERNATSFHAFIIDDGGNWDGSNDANLGVGSVDDFPLDVYLSTGYLDPDANHWLMINSTAPGYDWTNRRIPLTVAEPEGESPFIFEVQPGKLYADTDFRFSAYEPNASWFTVKVKNLDDASGNGDMEWGEWPGSHINGSSRLGAGSYTLTPVAHYADEDGNETGTKEGPAVTVQVEYRGKMPEPIVHASGAVKYGEGDGFTFSVESVHCMGDNWYDLRIHDAEYQWPENYDGEDDLSMVWIADRNSHGDGPDTFTVPWSCLQENHRYSVDTWIVGNGYEGTGYHFEFYVYSESNSQVLRLPEMLTEIDDEAFAGVNAQIIVLPSGVTSIGNRAFADCPNLMVVVSPIPVPDSAFEGCPNPVIVTAND